MLTIAKYSPISLVLVSVLLSCWLAAEPKPQRMTKRFFLYMSIYIVIWAYLCFRIYPRYIFIE
jgi:hypothetical protein